MQEEESEHETMVEDEIDESIPQNCANKAVFSDLTLQSPNDNLTIVANSTRSNATPEPLVNVTYVVQNETPLKVPETQRRRSVKFNEEDIENKMDKEEKRLFNN